MVRHSLKTPRTFQHQLGGEESDRGGSLLRLWMVMPGWESVSQHGNCINDCFRLPRELDTEEGISFQQIHRKF